MIKKPFFQRPAVQTVLASLLSILIGLLVGIIVIIIVGIVDKSLDAHSVIEAIQLVIGGVFSIGRDDSGILAWGFNGTSLGNMFFRATPLIMTGLSVALSYKTGLFNIGAPGQYLMGVTGTLFVALSIPSDKVSPVLIWILAFLAAVILGAIWGAIPGIFKARFHTNEVIVCIMTNWIAANFVSWAFDMSNLKNMTESTKSGYIYKTSFNNVSTSKYLLDKIFPGSQVNCGIIIAILFAIALYFFIYKTSFGYELRACGANRDAAKYAGLKGNRDIVLSMAISGGLAAAGAALYYLSGNTEFYWITYQTLPAVGFNGIPVAMLAYCNPIGVIFTALFMSMLDISGLQLTNLTAYNEYITSVIVSVIVYTSAFSLMIKRWISKRQKKGGAQK